MRQTSIRHHQESLTVQASAQTLYDLVSDITRTGEWSPVCTSCWWDDEANAGQPGAWFTGHNELPHRSWETRSQVVAAEPGREFAWVQRHPENTRRDQADHRIHPCQSRHPAMTGPAGEQTWPWTS